MSVKVQYTIPGWEPSPSAAPLPDTAPVLFEERLRQLGRPAATTWQQVLHLDSPQPGDLALPPPPRPQSHIYSDPAEDRRRWQSLLRRHVTSPSPSSPEVTRMLSSLARMEQNEMEIETRMTIEAQD